MDVSMDSIQKMLSSLKKEDLIAAMRFIQFLYYSDKINNHSESADVFKQLDTLFAGDKGGYQSEEDLIKDLAEFRKSRMN